MRQVALALVLAATAAPGLGSIDCSTAGRTRDELAIQIGRMLIAESVGQQLTREQRDRLKAMQERRRKLLVCG